MSTKMRAGGSPSGERRRARPLLVALTVVLLCPGVSRGAVSCPEVADRACNCDTRKGADQLGGWEIYCADDGYHVEYQIRKSVKLECSKDGLMPPLTPAMFRKYNLTDVDYVQFVMCALPANNLTLREVLEGVPVRRLKLEGDMLKLRFDSSTFEGLGSLLSLRLGRNQLESVPGDLLENLTQLKDVDLNENNLGFLPEDLFRETSNLVSVQLGSNELRELPPGIFANLTKLQRLYLYKNRLEELPDGIFLGLKSLTVLDLASNRIKELHPELFLDTPQLSDLNIRGNNLTRLQSDLFQGAKRLEVLDLSENRLTKLPETLLDGLDSLKKISLNNCNLKGIGETFFSFAAGLTNISMNDNRISSIPQGLFEKNPALEEIVVRYNDILELPGNLFHKNYRLRTLKLTHNDLTSLPAGLLDYLSDLRVLDLTGNLLKTLSANLLLQNQKLSELYVAKNRLTELQGNRPFGESSELRIVDLSENGIGALSDNINWEIYLNLEKLSLQGNNLTSVRVPNIFQNDDHDTEIDLTDNQIRLVKLETVIWLEETQRRFDSQPSKSVVRVALEGNPLECDCNLLGFFEYASRKRSRRLVEFGDLEELECREPPVLSGAKLTDVRPEEFVCPVTDGCPPGCQCVLRALDRSVLVNCSDLTELPERLPRDTKEVHLEDNRIDNLDALGSGVWDNVARLYLDRNNVTVGDWRLPANLTVLSLRGNRLEYMPQILMDYLENNPNIELYLADNPWICDCQTLDMKNWLNENTRKVVDSDEMMCANLVFQNGSEVRTAVRKLRDDVCPVDETAADSGSLVTVSVICVVLAVMLFVVSVLYYRNKQTVIAYLYIHFHHVFVCLFDKGDLDEDKTFDAFVSYSSADRDVAMELLSRLEPAFKLCIHERDWLPGNLISWNIVNSVQNSRKTILVLSKHFLESVWFQVEFHTAYYQMLEDRIDRLIVVVRGDLPGKDALDKDLQCLLSTKTFLQWGERWFWEKLRYALPHRSKTVDVPKDKNFQDKSFPLRQRPHAGMLRTAEEKIATLSVDVANNKRNEGTPNGVQTSSAAPNGVQASSAAPNGVQASSAAPNGVRTQSKAAVQVNSTKAQSRRFNGARTNHPQDAPQKEQAPREALPV